MGLRRQRRFVVALTVAALVLAACGGSSENDDDTADSPGGGGGGGSANLIVGTIENPSSIDPANVYEKFASDVLFNTTNRLVEYPPGATEPEPGLATEWEISDDGLTYTFTLRDGVKFHDGSDFDSEDVKYSLERAINVNDPDGASFLLQVRDEESGEPISGIASIETPDPMTVVMTLVEPNTTFLSRLNYTVASIVPSDSDAYKAPTEVLTGDVAGQLEEWENTDSIVGTGPYELKSYTPGESMVLERFDDFWGEPAKTEKVTVQFFQESAQLKNALDSGEIDLNVNDLGPTERSALADSVTAFQGEGARIRYLVIDVTKPPFDDVEARKALAAAIDRQRIVDEVFEGDAEPLTSMIPASFDQYAKDYFSDIEGDNGDAKIKFDLWYPLNKYGDTEADMAETLKRMLNESGQFEVTTKSADWASEYADNTGEGSPYGVYTLGWYPDYFDADDYIDPFYSSQGFIGHYKDDAMDALVKEEQTLTEESERADVFDQIQQKAAEDVPYIPLYTDASFAYYQKGDLEGVEETMDVTQQVRWFVISKG
jgi:peptide/nickel transport system substrate-binding protein